MALAMTRPWKHPETSIYWLRKRVPKELQALLGKREEKRSLRTREPKQAKRRLAQVLGEVDAQWANLRQGPKSLDEVEAHSIAGQFYSWFVAEHRTNPSAQTFWRADVGGSLWSLSPGFHCPRALDHWVSEIGPEAVRRQEMENWCISLADGYLQAHGMLVDQVGHQALARAIGSALQNASLTMSLSSCRPGSSFFMPVLNHQLTKFQALL